MIPGKHSQSLRASRGHPRRGYFYYYYFLFLSSGVACRCTRGGVRAGIHQGSLVENNLCIFYGRIGIDKDHPLSFLLSVGLNEVLALFYPFNVGIDKGFSVMFVPSAYIHEGHYIFRYSTSFLTNRPSPLAPP